MKQETPTTSLTISIEALQEWAMQSEDEPTFPCLTQRLERLLAQSTKSDESPEPPMDPA